MSKLLIPNSTQIPDVILDEWMSELSGSQFKVVMYIARRTYGFRKEADAISLSQICAGIVKKNGEVLDKGTGLAKSTVITAIDKLDTKYNYIIVHRDKTDQGDSDTNTYSLNIEVVRKSDNRGSAKTKPPVVRKSDTQDTVEHDTVDQDTVKKAEGSTRYIDSSTSDGVTPPPAFTLNPTTKRILEKTAHKRTPV